MNKTLLVLQREYKTRVAKKSFLLMTILVPLIIFGFYAAIIAIAVKDGKENQKIAVIDKANLFDGKNIDTKNLKYVFLNQEDTATYQYKFAKDGYSSLLFIPQFNVEKPEGFKVFSESELSFSVKGSIEKTINNAIERKRMVAANIDSATFKSIKADVSVESTIGTGKARRKGSTGGAFAIGYAAGILIYICMLIYGMMVMRGVMEEKINRISEVIISSVKPFQLMLGKILGIAAVGLTQFLIWIVLMGGLALLLPMLLPNVFGGSGAAAAQSAGGLSGLVNGLSGLPIARIVLCFLFYFIGGYFMYASLFAAVGSVVSEDQQEAQQLTFPITMPIILSFVILTRAVAEPNSGLALFGSLFPLTSPIVMMGRIAYDPPFWQIALSMIFLVVGFLGTTWAAGKIYRTGILLYGKKASWKEMMKWAFKA
ncbi:MAG: ABC transporter permease [Chitinophagaceae bacterium]